MTDSLHSKVWTARRGHDQLLPPLTGVHRWQESCGPGAPGRIHVIARQPIRVLDDALFADIHKDLLPTHGTYTVRKVFGRHARLAVELGEKSRGERQERCENQATGEGTTEAYQVF